MRFDSNRAKGIRGNSVQKHPSPRCHSGWRIEMSARESNGWGRLLLLAGGLTLWFVAGSVTSLRVVSYGERPFDPDAESQKQQQGVWLPIKAGAVWAGCSLVCVPLMPFALIRQVVGARPIAYSRSRPSGENVAMVLLVIKGQALVFGFGVGAMLAVYAIPRLGVPEGAVLATVRARVLWGSMLTLLANILCVPLAKVFLLDSER